MSFTTNLDLTKVEQGAKDWHIEWGSNLDILDAVIGKIKLTDGSSGALEAGMPVYISAASTVSLADATDGTKPAAAFCRTTDGTTARIRQYGIAQAVITVGEADIVPGDLVFLSTTPGKVTKTPPAASGNVIQVLGRAVTAEAAGKVDILLAINFNPVEV